MTVKELEDRLKILRKYGVGDSTPVLGFEISRGTPIKDKSKYFSVIDASSGERSEEYGGGVVVRLYHNTVYGYE